jgi:hypothetical protein
LGGEVKFKAILFFTPPGMLEMRNDCESFDHELYVGALFRHETYLIALFRHETYPMPMICRAPANVCHA